MEIIQGGIFSGTWIFLEKVHLLNKPLDKQHILLKFQRFVKRIINDDLKSKYSWCHRIKINFTLI